LPYTCASADLFLLAGAVVHQGCETS
jgi:hypothetical protein